MSQPSSPKPNEPSFEDAMQRLDDIVASMEDSQLSLEQMIVNYEEGVRLLKLCRQRIDGARQRVELISGDLDNGKAALTPFDEGVDPPTTDAPEAPRTAARRRKAAEPESGEIRLL